MRKILIAITVFLYLLSGNASAQVQPTAQLRGKIYDEYKSLEAALQKTKDTALIFSLRDTCMITIVQLDAYITMIGMMDSVRDKGLNKGTIDYIVLWLNEMRRTNDLNIKNLALPREMQKDTQVHSENMMRYFNELRTYADTELRKLAKLQELLDKAKK